MKGRSVSLTSYVMVARFCVRPFGFFPFVFVCELARRLSTCVGDIMNHEMTCSGLSKSVVTSKFESIATFLSILHGK